MPRPARAPFHGNAMSDYDPSLIRDAAARLHARARIAPPMSAVLGVAIGFIVAPHLLQAMPPAVSLRCPEWVVPLVFGIVGWLQGLERGAHLRLQAQAALCQLRIEENTRPR